MITDYDLACFAASVYGAVPEGLIIDWHDLRVVISDGIVCVRGTVPTSFMNWLRDFTMIPISTDFGLCHAGFLHAAVNLFAPVNAAIIGDYVLTGHSLGGAVSILLGAMLIRNGKPPSNLVTFAAPKTGGADLRMVYSNIPVTQYRYGNDPVPLVPYLPGVYSHIRDLTMIGKPMLDPIRCHFIAKTVVALIPPLIDMP